jgi:hypothetical protein
MRNRISKLAAAALIIVVAALAITFVGELTTPVYAIDQTIKANHSIRYIHIRQFMTSHDEPILIWAQFSPDGLPVNLRCEMPEWSQPDDGPKVVTWKDNKATVWLKNKNFVFVVQEKAFAARMLKMAEENDPISVVQRLRELADTGQVRIEINQPSDRSEPIIVTAIHLPQSPTPNRKLVVFVDQVSKLALSIELYELENGAYQKRKVLEFHDYNREIDPGMFVLEKKESDDITIVDQTTQEVGLAQGELSDEEIAVKLVRCFFEALISKDYAEVGRLYHGIPEAKMHQAFSDTIFVSVLSVGNPIPDPEFTGKFRVPCTVEIEKDGKTTPWQPCSEGLLVGEVQSQPGRWTIFGGI